MPGRASQLFFSLGFMEAKDASSSKTRFIVTGALYVEREVREAPSPCLLWLTRGLYSRITIDSFINDACL